jgi:hypothetical protein
MQYWQHFQGRAPTTNHIQQAQRSCNSTLPAPIHALSATHAYNGLSSLRQSCLARLLHPPNPAGFEMKCAAGLGLYPCRRVQQLLACLCAQELASAINQSTAPAHMQHPRCLVLLNCRTEAHDVYCIGLLQTMPRTSIHPT